MSEKVLTDEDVSRREQAILIARRHAKAKPQSYYAEPFQPHEWVISALVEVLTIADGLLNHCDKEGGECRVCSVICCPLKDPLHFHHDGCPSCSQEPANG